ncbi:MULTISPECIES: hypothetical protein [Mycolicibacterium]|uniref:hypothetical protein n=1 Tax=Mycolicibacterium TaxID=1866885 RepID=UPI0007E9669E|nr:MULTISPECIES: hypothetical protein [Mycolicibacterium]MCV6998860.1 hypothetical protein [Mycolicibacterium alvei]OBG15214.1 hypothetical protein A5768_07500 [Mycolicibacterium fortuitum]
MSDQSPPSEWPDSPDPHEAKTQAYGYQQPAAAPAEYSQQPYGYEPPAAAPVAYPQAAYSYPQVPGPDSYPQAAGWPGSGAPAGPGYPPAAPYAQGYPMPQQPAKKGHGLLIGGLIVGAVLIAFMVFVAPLLFIGKMTDDIKDIAGPETEQILENELDVTFGTYKRDTKAYKQERGVLPVTLKNKGTQKYTFTVQIEAVDGDGNRIADDTVYAQYLSPGQATTLDAFGIGFDDQYSELKNATFRVAGVSRH